MASLAHPVAQLSFRVNPVTKPLQQPHRPRHTRTRIFHTIYDRYGNRTFDTTANRTTTIPAGCPTALCNPSVDPATNKLIGYQFDNSGNTKVDANGQTFTYDAENRQVKVQNGSTTIGEYFYDGDGRRIKKIVPATGEITIFVYDSTGRTMAEYSTAVVPTQEAKLVYLTADHLGSPRITTDGLGQVISRRDFRPFGEEISRQNYGQDSVRRKFTSYERDGETSLDYAIARYNNSNLGRFVSADPYVIIFEMKRGKDAKEQLAMLNEYIAEPRNWNKYLYALNNPLKHTDPTGMRPANEWEQKALNKLDELIAAANKAGNKDLATALTNAKNEISQIIAKLGKKENSVPVGIAVFAILSVGTEEGKKYADDQALAAPGQTYGAGESKCNVFVAMAHINGGGIAPGNYPSVNGKFAVANWLGDIRDSMKLKNLPVYYGAAGVGDVVAWRNTDPNKSGHSGISIGGGAMIYAGGPSDGTPQVQTINYVNQRMNTEGTSILGITISGPSHAPGVIRRYNGKP